MAKYHPIPAAQQYATPIGQAHPSAKASATTGARGLQKCHAATSAEPRGISPGEPTRRSGHAPAGNHTSQGTAPWERALVATLCHFWDLRTSMRGRTLSAPLARPSGLPGDRLSPPAASTSHWDTLRGRHCLENAGPSGRPAPQKTTAPPLPRATPKTAAIGISRLTVRRRDLVAPLPGWHHVEVVNYPITDRPPCRRNKAGLPLQHTSNPEAARSPARGRHARRLRAAASHPPRQAAARVAVAWRTLGQRDPVP